MCYVTWLINVCSEVRTSVTGWRRPIGCLKLQVTFCKRATIHRALLQKMTYKDKASYDSPPPCNNDTDNKCLFQNLPGHSYIQIYIHLLYSAGNADIYTRRQRSARYLIFAGLFLQIRPTLKGCFPSRHRPTILWAPPWYSGHRLEYYKWPSLCTYTNTPYNSGLFCGNVSAKNRHFVGVFATLYSLLSM